jgi:hypothetical protein
MYIGGSLFLIVVGAILKWAVNVNSPEFDINLAGLIILIVGILGLVISLVLWFTYRNRGETPPPPPHDYPPSDYPPRDYQPRP